jgi:hypothetical protein
MPISRRQVPSPACSLEGDDGQSRGSNCKHGMGHAGDIGGIGVNAQYPQRAILPANCELKLKDAAIAFLGLELNDGCIVYFDPSIKLANVTVVTLTLHGKSTIDLTPRVTLPPAPGKSPTPPQPGNSLLSQKGIDGSRGGDGSAGTELNINVQTLIATDGSLWIKTDGTAGGAGGEGGDGAKGSGPNITGTHCYDGGTGGNGGRGGNGGKGGDTARVTLKIGQNTPNPVKPTQTKDVAPSTRPDSANSPGVIIVAGAPGPGGPGGRGGRGGDGGDGGEGRECHFPASDANPGPNGSDGPAGSPGVNGQFIP